MEFRMKVFYLNGEVDVHIVDFEGFDLEGEASPKLNFLIFRSEDKSIAINLSNVKHIEWEQDEDDGEY